MATASLSVGNARYKTSINVYLKLYSMHTWTQGMRREQLSKQSMHLLFGQSCVFTRSKEQRCRKELYQMVWPLGTGERACTEDDWQQHPGARSVASMVPLADASPAAFRNGEAWLNDYTGIQELEPHTWISIAFASAHSPDVTQQGNQSHQNAFAAIYILIQSESRQ